MTIDEIAKRVDHAIDILSPIPGGHIEGYTSDDTMLALGFALGALVKARELLFVDLATAGHTP